MWLNYEGSWPVAACVQSEIEVVMRAVGIAYASTIGKNSASSSHIVPSVRKPRVKGTRKTCVA